MNKLMPVCLVVSLVWSPARGAAGELDPAAVKLATAEIRKAVEKGEAAGCSHLVVIDGKEAHFTTAGFRDIDEKKPFTRDTIVRIYSMSKPITSVAAMTLFEQGKFELDDPVSKYIPSFANTRVIQGKGENAKLVPPKRPITVRDLLRHTSGYTYGAGNPLVEKAHGEAKLKYRDPIGMYPPKMSIEKAADALAKIPALHHPGARFTYGLNTDVIGRLIEVWSGKRLDEYLAEAVFEPLEMKDTSFSVPENKRGRFASCHTHKSGKLAVADSYKASEYNKGFEFLSGGGGLVSTIDDYSKFCLMLVNGGQLDGKRVLKSRTVELMFTDQLSEAEGDFKFGLGFAVEDITLGTGDAKASATQVSWGGYASTAFRIVPEERMYQIVFRQHVPSANGLAGRIIPMIYEGFRRD